MAVAGAEIKLWTKVEQEPKIKNSPPQHSFKGAVS